MPDDKNKALKYVSGSKSLKVAHVIYADIECQLVKHDAWSNDKNKSWSKIISIHVPAGHAINIANEYKDNYHIYYRGIDCMTILSKD